MKAPNVKYSLLPSLLLLATAACSAGEDTEASRDKLSTRIMEAYKESPERQMMVPKTGDKSITELKKPSTPLVAPDNSESAKEKSQVVDLPAVTVQSRKETETTWEAKKTVVELDKKIENEKQRTVPTEADEILNGKKLSIMGAADAEGRATDAKRRVHELEVKQSVAAVATDPSREEENKKLLKMLQDLEYQKRQH